MDIWLPAIILLALLVGWLLGRLTRPTVKSSISQDTLSNCNESYIQGLNYLLANNSDKAIELFVELVKVDGETMETHLALGNLFRSKGQVDRAIKIHQNLLARPNLDQKQRVMAVSELAEDYMKAGLLDRAENLYRELVQIDEDNDQAHRKLFELYCLEKSWFQAVKSAENLLRLNQPDARLILSHCYCELAQQSLSIGELRKSREYLDKAVEIDEKCSRALLLLIEMHLKNKDLKQAGSLFEQLTRSQSPLLDLLIPPARELLLNNGSVKKYQEFLLEQYRKTASSPYAVELLENYLASDQHHQLQAFLKQVLQDDESIDVLSFALRYFRKKPVELDENWALILQQAGRLQNRRLAYICNHCGYGSHTLFWNCPSCNTWASLKPYHQVSRA